MTEGMRNALIGTFLALIFFKIFEKLSNKKFFNKKLSGGEKLLDYYNASTTLLLFWVNSIFSRKELILYCIGAYIFINIFLKLFKSDFETHEKEKYLKVITTSICTIFTIYQFVFFLTLKDGTVIENFDRSAYFSTMIYLLIGFFIVNIYFLIKNLRTIFTKEDIYRKVFTVIDVIFILSQDFFIIYNLVKADKFVFY
ncbi:hypothetical protein I6I93_07665 [Peptoniphilus harei]|uniref:Uncharacterized protein n=1 Tax=Peptoniphilus harei TaxID=54005 RepID=A0A2X1ZWH0_9FIRM|nr:hypothetical protein [Peptoniphilus harei]QQT90752.1 hypothetical protein I6I93_07665 [Peptoniphilus harei]SPY48365.1 Uncharacterised protein [Peptoniphilus harei]